MSGGITSGEAFMGLLEIIQQLAGTGPVGVNKNPQYCWKSPSRRDHACELYSRLATRLVQTYQKIPTDTSRGRELKKKVGTSLGSLLDQTRIRFATRESDGVGYVLACDGLKSHARRTRITTTPSTDAALCRQWRLYAKRGTPPQKEIKYRSIATISVLDLPEDAYSRQHIADARTILGEAQDFCRRTARRNKDAACIEVERTGTYNAALRNALISYEHLLGIDDATVSRARKKIRFAVREAIRGLDYHVIPNCARRDDDTLVNVAKAALITVTRTPRKADEYTYRLTLVYNATQNAHNTLYTYRSTRARTSERLTPTSESRLFEDSDEPSYLPPTHWTPECESKTSAHRRAEHLLLMH